MMRNKEFYDITHAHRYLSNSIIIRNGKPIFVDRVQASRTDKLQIIYRNMTNKENQKISYLSDKSIDMSPISLGMYHYKYNGQHKAIFIARYPVRMWKIGLTTNSIMIKTIQNEGPPGTSTSRIIWSHSFEKMVLGQYLDLDSVLRHTKKAKDNSVPVSKRFAVCNNQLYYKGLGEPVANLTDNGFKLVEGFEYLEEVLKEDVAYVDA